MWIEFSQQLEILSERYARCSSALEGNGDTHARLNTPFSALCFLGEGEKLSSDVCQAKLCGEPARWSLRETDITQSPDCETKEGKWDLPGSNTKLDRGKSGWRHCWYHPCPPHLISHVGAAASLSEGFLCVDESRHYCNNKHELVIIIAIVMWSSTPKIYESLMRSAL